jgi:hypothetical protein
MCGCFGNCVGVFVTCVPGGKPVLCQRTFSSAFHTVCFTQLNCTVKLRVYGALEGRFTHTMPFPCCVKGRFTHTMPFPCRVKGRLTHTMPFPCRVKGRFTHNMPFPCRVKDRFTHTIPFPCSSPATTLPFSESALRESSLSCA